jgi:hypothetical protein
VRAIAQNSKRLPENARIAPDFQSAAMRPAGIADMLPGAGGAVTLSRTMRASPQLFGLNCAKSWHLDRQLNPRSRRSHFQKSNWDSSPDREFIEPLRAPSLIGFSAF